MVYKHCVKIFNGRWASDKAETNFKEQFKLTIRHENVKKLK